MTPQQARARGRFTRNFVIQATAAEWALALIACLRSMLSPDVELVFFQHDEVVLHCPTEQADAVAAGVREASEQARRLLFADSPVRFPVNVAVVRCYADAG